MSYELIKDVDSIKDIVWDLLDSMDYSIKGSDLNEISGAMACDIEYELNIIANELLRKKLNQYKV